VYLWKPSSNEGDILGVVRAAIEVRASPDGLDPRTGPSRICDGFCAVRPGDSEAEIGESSAGTLMVVCSRNCCCLAVPS